MKTKSLIVIAILTLGLVTSCQEENESLRTDSELIQSLKADIEFKISLMKLGLPNLQLLKG